MGGCRPEPGRKITLLRPAFLSMVASYSLGSFNENFFKEAAMLIAVAEGKAYLQGYATVLFTLPFLIFAAPAGWLADRFSKRRVMIAVKLVEVFAMSLGAPRCPAASPGEKFPWDGPATTVRNLFRLRKDTLFAVTILTDVFIYTVGSLEIQVINKLGLKQLGYDETVTGLMVVAELVGFGIGGLISSMLARGERWYRVLAPACFLMAIFTGAMSATPLLYGLNRLWAVFILLAGTGASGGLLLIPCESFVQIRPEPHRKGAVIAAVNFAIFSGILLSGPVANILNANLHPTTGFGVIGVISVLYGTFLLFVFRGRRLR